MRSTRPVTTATVLAAARGSCAPADAAVSRTVDRTVRAKSGVRTMRAPPKPAVYARPWAEGKAIRSGTSVSARRSPTPSASPAGALEPRHPGPVIEVRIVAVARRDRDVFLDRPVDAERRVVPAHAESERRHIDVGHLVEDVGIVGQRLKAVRQERRDEQGVAR